MATIREVFGLNVVKPSMGTNVVRHPGIAESVANIKIPSEELIGIEVEVENITFDTRNILNTWQVTEDGSLRNSGVEFITRPIPAFVAPAALQYLLKTFLNNDCSFSQRTSVHVHLNAQDMDMTQVSYITALYMVFEPFLYNFVGRGRRRNIYCVPLADTRLPRHQYENGLRGWSKYTGLNLLPLGDHGTLEFRHMHGTTDVHKLCTWIDIITRLKAYVMKTSPEVLKAYFMALCRGTDIQKLAVEVFGQELTDILRVRNGVSDPTVAKLIFVPTTTITRAQRDMKGSAPFFKVK